MRQTKAVDEQGSRHSATLFVYKLWGYRFIQVPCYLEFRRRKCNATDEEAGYTASQ